MIATKPIKKNTKERKERAVFFRAMNKSARTKSMVGYKIEGKEYFVGYAPPTKPQEMDEV